MGSIRYETAYASAYFIESLKAGGQLGEMLHNGWDIVLFALPNGAKVSVHFIDSALPVYEIRKTLTENAAQGIHTLFMLWAEMMLPAHGQIYRADDWMEALYTLYGNTIYAYDIFDGEIFLFPVYFRGEGLVRRAEFGTTLRFEHLAVREVTTHLAELTGTWQVADFGGAHGTAHDPVVELALAKALREAYAILGVTPGDSPQTIKRAYRLLARRYHPDLNDAPEAHEEMQRLNSAYARILESFEER